MPTTPESGMKARAQIGAWHNSLDRMPAVILCISSVKLLIFFKFDLIETFGLKYVTRFLRSLIATLHSLIQDNRILLDTPKNVPIFLHMQTESKSSQPFVPVQLNERDAKQKRSDGIISW